VCVHTSPIPGHLSTMGALTARSWSRLSWPAVHAACTRRAEDHELTHNGEPQPFFFSSHVRSGARIACSRIARLHTAAAAARLLALPMLTPLVGIMGSDRPCRSVETRSIEIIGIGREKLEGSRDGSRDGAYAHSAQTVTKPSLRQRLRASAGQRARTLRVNVVGARDADSFSLRIRAKELGAH
jgi:hypothetical protein